MFHENEKAMFSLQTFWTVEVIHFNQKAKPGFRFLHLGFNIA